MKSDGSGGHACTNHSQCAGLLYVCDTEKGGSSEGWLRLNLGLAVCLLSQVSVSHHHFLLSAARESGRAEGSIGTLTSKFTGLIYNGGRLTGFRAL